MDYIKAQEYLRKKALKVKEETTTIEDRKNAGWVWLSNGKTKRQVKPENVKKYLETGYKLIKPTIK